MPEQKQERRRLSPLEKIQQLRAKADELEAQALKQQRKDDARRKILLGGAAIAEARENPTFAKMFADVIEKRITKAAEKELVQQWQVSI